MRDGASRLRTLAILSGKGGTGKTTLSVNLAIAAHLRGLRVLVADADPQRSAADVLRMRRGPGPARIDTCGAKLFQLGQTAERDGFDLMVIDTPPGAETEMVSAVNVSDLCLLLARPSFLDVASAVRSAEVVRRVGGRGVVVLNQAPSARCGQESAAVITAVEALRFAGLPLAPIGLRSRAALQAAIGRGLSVEEWAPGRPAAIELGRLWEHVHGLLEAESLARRA